MLTYVTLNQFSSKSNKQYHMYILFIRSIYYLLDLSIFGQIWNFSCFKFFSLNDPSQEFHVILKSLFWSVLSWLISHVSRTFHFYACGCVPKSHKWQVNIGGANWLYVQTPWKLLGLQWMKDRFEKKKKSTKMDFSLTLLISETINSLWPTVAVFKISAGPRTLTGKICVGPASFSSLSYINFPKIVLWSGKFQILFWRLR